MAEVAGSFGELRGFWRYDAIALGEPRSTEGSAAANPILTSGVEPLDLKADHHRRCLEPSPGRPCGARRRGLLAISNKRKKRISGCSSSNPRMGCLINTDTNPYLARSRLGRKATFQDRPIFRWRLGAEVLWRAGHCSSDLFGSLPPSLSTPCLGLLSACWPAPSLSRMKERPVQSREKVVGPLGIREGERMCCGQR